MKKSALTDTLLIALLTVLLIAPLFKLKYMDNWPSIESTFIGDARMLSANLPHPGWQPLWYCGTRFDYVYPPALRYGPALIAKAGGFTTARAYHLYTAVLYVFGIVGVYWLVLVGSRSRFAALLSSAATALLSPSFLLLRQIRHDSPHWIPQRLHVLLAYGEGPHISSLSILAVALAASLMALRKWKPAAFAAAGVLCALVVANNFYGATALAIFFPIMVWSVWVCQRDAHVWWRALGIVALAYGLSAIWLTPSYLKITVLNLAWVSEPGNAWSSVATLIVAALFCAVSLRFAGDKAERQWTLFVAGSTVFLALDVLGFFYFGFRMAGEPVRLIPELDLALILAFFEIMRRVWSRPAWRRPAAILILLAFAPSVRYLTHAWTFFPKAGAIESQYEFQTAKWVHDHLPGERVLPSGTVRFWFNVWFDNAQPDGGSLQGMLNQNIPGATWQINNGKNAALAVQWLQALGTDAVIVPGKNSPETYRDYQFPYKFRGVIPVLFDDGHDTVIYQVPRVHPTIGRIVDRTAMEHTRRIGGGDDAAALSLYVDAIENKDQPLTAVNWKGFDEADVQAKTEANQSVLLQETYDPAWHAYEQGREVKIRPEPVMGFMLMDLPAGNHAIQMRFETPLENRVGQILLMISLLAVVALILPVKRFWGAEA